MEKLINDLKLMIIDTLSLEDMSPDDIDTHEALFNEGLGLDSIDALELGVALKNNFNISVKNENEEDIKNYFYSVQTLAEFIESKNNT